MSAALDLSRPRTGLFVKLPARQVIDLAWVAGFDFVIVDLEHSQLGFEDASALVAQAEARGLPALVRLPAIDAGLVNRLLEAGAVGIQLSTVRSCEEVSALRAAMNYAPLGRRSIGTAHPGASYGRVATPDYVGAWAESPPLLVAQIETATTVDPPAAIARAGADVLFVGQADLRVALGFDEGKVASRVEEIITAADDAGVAAGGIGLPAERSAYRVLGADIQLLGSAFEQRLESGA